LRATALSSPTASPSQRRPPSPERAAARASAVSRDPFTLGVASGDPDHQGFVLWTRLTGDVHAHWASDLKLNYDDPASRTVGSELVCSSITSGGDGSDSRPADNSFLKINTHLRFYNNQRGYVLTQITEDQLKADFKVVPYVTRQGAPSYTRATFVIDDPRARSAPDLRPAARRRLSAATQSKHRRKSAAASHRHYQDDHRSG
jgi:phosphodiesterase/alkaline phosphatase D-like protein